MTANINMHTFNDLKDSTGADFINELIDTFLEDTPDLIQQMNDSAVKKDVGRFLRAAHSMKSNAATFGAMELSVIAKELEGMARENNLEVGNRLTAIQEAYDRAADQLQALKQV